MKHPNTAQYYRNVITRTLPKGTVVPDHDTTGHWYRVPSLGPDIRYPSVNGRIHIFKEEGLADWRMNKALEYIFKHFEDITKDNLMEYIASAEQQSVTEFHDASDIGRDIHDYREQIFTRYIDTGKYIEVFDDIIPVERQDIRAISAMGALQKFVNDYHYESIATELYVYSSKLKLAGTLDDIGLIWTEVRKGTLGCEHDMIDTHCVKCPLKYKKDLCLMDLKSSNYLKPIYWIQVALYYHMFRALTGLSPRKMFILKLDKNNRTYKVEFMKDIARVVRVAKLVLRLSDDLDWLKEARIKQAEVI